LANRQGLNGKKVVYGLDGSTERFKGDGNFLGECKEGDLNRLGWRRSMPSCFDLWWLGATMSYS